jgi:hypothetical protein
MNHQSNGNSAKLVELTSQLRALDLELKSGESPQGPLLREFRQALDHVRMTAWTTNELMDARQAQRNPEALLSFLTSERLRRFTQMVKELCADVDAHGLTWETQGIQGLSESLDVLRDRLERLSRRGQAEPARNPRLKH